jgi:hypothetical protein
MYIDRLEQIRATTIDNNSMNDRLLCLYENCWDEYQKINCTFKNQGYELANIYLLAASNEYVKAEVKIFAEQMIFAAVHIDLAFFVGVFVRPVHTDVKHPGYLFVLGQAAFAPPLSFAGAN